MVVGFSSRLSKLWTGVMYNFVCLEMFYNLRQEIYNSEIPNMIYIQKDDDFINFNASENRYAMIRATKVVILCTLDIITKTVIKSIISLMHIWSFMPILSVTHYFG